MVSRYLVYVILYSTHNDFYYCAVLYKDSMSFVHYVFYEELLYKTRMGVADRYGKVNSCYTRVMLES